MDNKEKENKENKMRTIKIDNVTLHCSTADKGKLARSEKLLELISKRKCVQTISKKRIPTWNIRPGLAVGCKVTLRGKHAVEVLKAIFAGISSFNEKQFNPGLLSLGIKEYIQIPSVPYQREIGIIGFDVAVALKRPGYNITKRKIRRNKIGAPHKITKNETIQFFKENYNIDLEE